MINIAPVAEVLGDNSSHTSIRIEKAEGNTTLGLYVEPIRDTQE